MRLNIFRLRMKIIIGLLVAFMLLVGGLKRSFAAYNSDPNAVAFCTVAPVVGYALYHWRCFTNDALYNHVLALQKANFTAGYWVSAEPDTLLAKLLSPSVVEAAGCVKAYSALGSAASGTCPASDADAIPTMELVRNVHGDTAVLVYDPANESYEIKKMQDSDASVNCADYCAGTATSNPLNVNGYVWIQGTCSGACGNPQCIVSWRGSATGGVQKSEYFSGTVKKDCGVECYGGVGLATAAQAQEACKDKRAESVAAKVVDDSAAKNKIASAMGADAAKGATPATAPPSGATDTNEGKGNQGVASTPSSAVSGISGRTASGQTATAGTISGGDTAATNQKLDAIKNQMTGGADTSTFSDTSGGKAKYRSAVGQDIKDGFSQGFSDAFNNFVNNMKSTSLFSSTASFFASAPSGGLGSITINGGTTFGSTQVNLGSWLSFFTILRGAVVVACTYVAIRIVTKGGA